MNRIRICLAICLSVLLLAFSCDPEIYMIVKNKTDKTLYLTLDDESSFVIRPFQERAIIGFYQSAGYFYQCLLEYNQCKLQENDSAGRVLRQWSFEYLPTSDKKEFFRESDWERRKTSNDVPDYIFNITKNDLEISE